MKKKKLAVNDQVTDNTAVLQEVIDAPEPGCAHCDTTHKPDPNDLAAVRPVFTPEPGNVFMDQRGLIWRCSSDRRLVNERDNAAALYDFDAVLSDRGPLMQLTVHRTINKP